MSVQELWEQRYQPPRSLKAKGKHRSAQGHVWQLTDTSLLLRAVISLSLGLPLVWEWDSLSALWALGPGGVRGG